MTKKKVPVKKSPYPSFTVFTAKVTQKKIQFPKIPRFITEHPVSLLMSIVKRPTFVFHMLSFIILIAVVYQGTVLVNTWGKFSLVQQEQARLYQEVSYWQDITTKFANYRDGYFSLAVLYYRLGNDTKAKENIDKVLSIDPRFEQGIAFAQVLKQ